MKAKKSSGEFRQDSDSFKGKRKHKLAPIKKQKSQKTQFFDQIEEDDEYDLGGVDDLYGDLDDFEDEDIDDF
jgi:hypothetical protein